MALAAPERRRFVLAMAVGTAACGLILWPIPYEAVALLQGAPPLASWLLAGAGSGLVAGYLLRSRFGAATLAVPAGFALAVLGRVVVETWADRTSHNLWPFEVGIAVGLGAIAGVLGVGLARALQRLRARGSQGTATDRSP